MDQNKAEGVKARLFVGGLSSDVSSLDLKERFAPLGTVLNVSTPPAKFGSGPHRGFAYVDFIPSSDASLRKLFSAYNGCKWRGGILRIEMAKEHYIDKLQKEWAAEAEALAAKEAEELQKKNVVPAVLPAKQAKAWPLLLLERPENPDRLKRKGVPVADDDGLKIFFPRLKKVKTVPSKGLGRHKKSFQRVESLPLQQLSTCDCDESLRTGSCEARDERLVNGGEDPVSLAIAKERQRQLDLLSKLFPSDSPRNSKPAEDLRTSSESNRDETKKAHSRVGKEAKTQVNIHSSERQASAVETSSPHIGTCDDSRVLTVPVIKEDSSRRKAALEMVKRKVSEPQEVSPSHQKGEKDIMVEADEPEMWVSFMDTMPLPAKTEDNVSEFDLDELSLMMNEEEEESDEEEEEEKETEEVVPDAPKKKVKRKKKGKKSKLTPDVKVRDEQVNIKGESDSHPKTTVNSPSTSRDKVELTPSNSEELLASSREEVKISGKGAPVQAAKSKKDGGSSQPWKSSSDELKTLANGTGIRTSDVGTDSSDEENHVISPLADDTDDFFVGDSSSDESFDAGANEGELWVSGINEVERTSIYVDPVDASSKEQRTQEMGGGTDSRSFLVQDHKDEDGRSRQNPARASTSGIKLVRKLSKADTSKRAKNVHFTSDEESDDEDESSEYAVSDDSVEPEGDEPEDWVSSLEPGEEEETSEDLISGDEEEHSELWVSGLEMSTSTVPRKSKEDPEPVVARVSASFRETPEEASGAAVLTPISSDKDGKYPVNKTQEGKLQKQDSSNPAIEDPQFAVAKDQLVNEGSAPKRNELTRATWKSLVGETGRVVFSLQQILGRRTSDITPPTDKSPDADSTQPEERAEAEGKDAVNFAACITPDEKKLVTMYTAKPSFQSRKEMLELDAPPLIPVFTDSNVCTFMKSPDAEKEWLATKADLRTDYRSKHKQAVKKSRKLRGR